MRKSLFLIVIVLSSLLYFTSCKQRIRIVYPGGVNIESPVIRVGLDTGKANLKVSSTAGLKVYFNGQRVFNNVQGVVEFTLNNGAIKVLSGKDSQILKGNIFLIPQKDSLLKIGENEYRGIFFLLNRGDYINLINILNIEDYLKGVLPYELSPSIYGEIEALKAQAIAARTYALYTLKKFDSEGFDICATKACQVYRGASGEMPLSNKAVEETKGKVLTYEGKIAAALYSASCGGFTEYSNKMFKGMNYPYLIGQPCEYDSMKWYWIYTDNFKPYSLEIDFAIAINLVDEFDVKRGNKKISTEKAAKILKKISLLVGKEETFLLDKVNIISLLEPFDGLFSLHRKAKELLKPFEIPKSFTIRYGKRKSYMIQYLIKNGIIDKNERLSYPLNFNHFVEIVSKMIMKNFKIFEEAKFVSLLGKTLNFKDKTGKDIMLNADSPILLRRINGKIYPAHMVYLTGKEKVKFFSSKQNIKILLVEYPKFSLKPDNLYPFWHKIYSLKELEKTIRAFTPIAKLHDIVPLERGISGRVIKLEIQDENRSQFLYGFQINKALGLKDTLFFIDREFEGDNIKRITFIGRGYGHGVGMCQVGAYGMAKKGKDYKDILSYYYPGTTIMDYFDLEKKKK